VNHCSVRPLGFLPREGCRKHAHGQSCWVLIRPSPSGCYFLTLQAFCGHLESNSINKAFFLSPENKGKTRFNHSQRITGRDRQWRTLGLFCGTRISDSHTLRKTALSLEKYSLPMDIDGLLAIFEYFLRTRTSTLHAVSYM